MITSIGVPKSISLTKPAGSLFPSCGEDGVDCYFLLRRHAMRILAGLVALYVAYRIPLRFWRRVAIPMFLLMVIVLFGVLVIGQTFNTTARAWLRLANTSIQPAEFAKIALVFYLAAWMERKGKDIQDFKNGFLSFCAVVSIIVLPVLLQPDFGSTLVYASIATVIYFAAGARLRHIGLGLLAVTLFLTLVVPNVGYLKHRFTAFVNPTVENCQPAVGDQEQTRNYCWQTQQAQIAVGSGKFFGKGLTQGIQKSYWLPQATDDFIFAATAEELGFARITLLILAYLVIAYRGILIAQNADDTFSKLTAVGLTAWLVFQAFINIGVNVGLLPVTGITLPFISYGGTSMVATLIAVGILLQISRGTAPYANSLHRRRNRGTHLPQYRGY
ncbi:cell division protein FtsW [Candidatus Gracilibacteria bacterium]|nr:cell division protein FtsW [Candidatus Gracilibacteria bacterium]